MILVTTLVAAHKQRLLHYTPVTAPAKAFTLPMTDPFEATRGDLDAAFQFCTHE